ncbi:phosphoglycerate dehydrogenase [Alkalicaulis satelles]|uniref:Phosphoglycerate dehydrogenase n=1 Tax=Alkalicaulis satelles TaxID=2609175 RepID=A0A5M6ZK65_9PROT|nr:phosphoglycerate dehydrogenase [Alkalicaulis satelles]KAA5803618.1 phosphoglycerate dehydrogenase [Alkalicaulis satelles]
MTETQPDALLVENVHPDADAALSQLGPVSIRRLPGSPAPETLRAEAAKAKLLGIRSRTQVDAALLDVAPDLLAVGCFCIGTNQVDLSAAATRGVPVFNAPFANTRSVAELAIASIIMLMRRVPEKMTAIDRGEWLKSAEGSNEVRKKKLGIVGYGNIGAQLSVIASALGMHVYFYDIEPKLAHGNARPMESLDALIAESDVVTLHVPSTARTRNLMDASRIAAMKPGAFLINQARGDLVDVDALAAALRSGHLAGAAVDVFPVEPKGKDERFESPLIGCPNVILTPHIGGSTLEAQAAIGLDAATKLAKFLYEGSTSHAVNFPQVDAGPLQPGRTRILAPHLNRPGYLRKLNDASEQAGLNVAAQFLRTEGEIGYAIADLEGALPSGFLDIIRAIDGTIRARAITA